MKPDEQKIDSPAASRRMPGPARYHAAILIGAAAILIVGGIWRGGGEKTEPKSEASLIEELRKEVAGLMVGINDSELGGIQETIAKTGASAIRSVVAIRPVQTLRSIRLYSDVRTPASVPPSSATLSPGLSGIVMDAEGHILTSANVANLGHRVQLIFADGEQREGDVLGIDSEEFVGLLKISSPPANILAPDFSRGMPELRPGEWLIRQGRSPSGQPSVSLCLLESVRFGAKDRPVGLLDSPAAPETDGGAVVNLNALIVGLYVSPPQAPAFVVPIQRALEVAKRVKEGPRETPPQSWVGLELQDLTDDLREYFDLQAGVLITRVMPNSPAARAGLRAADIIQTLDKTAVESASQVTGAIAEKPAGTNVEIGIRRNVQNRVVTVVTAANSTDVSDGSNKEELSLKIQEGSSAGGAAIVAVGPPLLANRLGLRVGDEITSVNGRPVRTSAELIRLVRALREGKPHLFQVKRGDHVFFVGIKERVIIDE